jgi:hypothetical protein
MEVGNKHSLSLPAHGQARWSEALMPGQPGRDFLEATGGARGDDVSFRVVSLMPAQPHLHVTHSVVGISHPSNTAKYLNCLFIWPTSLLSNNAWILLLQISIVVRSNSWLLGVSNEKEQKSDFPVSFAEKLGGA